MSFFENLNYAYNVLFIVLLLFMLTELTYRIMRNTKKINVEKMILIFRKVYLISLIIIIYISATMLYTNGYGIINNNLYYFNSTFDIFIGLSLSASYIPVLYLFVRTAEIHSRSSNVFTRNKFRFFIDIVVFGVTITVFILNSNIASV